MFGFFRLSAAVPRLELGDAAANAAEIVRLYQLARHEGSACVVFPELSVTGYSCGDLFFQPRLLQAAWEGALEIARATGETVAVFGLPVRIQDAVYNVAAVAQHGAIRGLVPKSVLPNYREFYEKRQFTPARRLAVTAWRGIPVGTDLIFQAGETVSFGVEICEDLWSVVPPSSWLALGGARIICNLSAGTELTAKADYRRELVRQQSARLVAAYVLASAGVHESTTDAVFAGHAMIAENGRLAAENSRFLRQSQLLHSDVDIERLITARASESSFHDNELPEGLKFRTLELAEVPGSPDLVYTRIAPTPFVPPEAQRRERCREILAIQSAGLARRIEHTRAKSLVIGISGGLDSTLALLVAVESCRLLDLAASTVIGVTMPGFGTTGRTYRNALELCRLLGVSTLEVDIKEACHQHFADIGHDPACHDVTYENAQARERTQILMDLANRHHGFVIGTGDLSEIALGWSTYNGDHMSMYAVNASVPKTLIRFLIEEIALESGPELARVLRDVNATPVSPELLPPAPDGTIQQQTEAVIGAYELHDFFLYHFLKYGAEPEKLAFLAEAAFGPSPAIERTLAIFLKRFFQQQFKRNCMPDGPKVGTIALSPRGDWRMPSDISNAVWG